MKYSLRTKLSVSYLLVALITVSLIIILTNIFLEKQFTAYVKENQEERNRQLAASVSQQYSSGSWDMGAIENIGVNALGNGLILRIENTSGTILWDARVHNNGMCQHIIVQMSQVMGSRYPNLEGGYAEKTYPVLSGGKTVGQLFIGYYGPFYLTNSDLTFIDSLNRLIIGAGIFCMLLAFGLGAIMAKRLSTPISRVINAAQTISRGDFGERIEERSNTTEIGQLTAAVNEMAGSLGNQEILRRRLTGDVAHELRTPLATLQSHMEAMIDGIWLPDKERLAGCHEEILRLSRMVGDLETLSRYENDQMILEKSEFDLSELVQQMIRNFERNFSQKGVAIYFSGEEHHIRADRDKISQLLVNLISNGLKYTPAGGKVEINVDKTHEGIRITVCDNGIGISKEDLPFVFERFYRADLSRNRSSGGSGIGLTITKAIVEAHGGKIMAESEPGRGSKFTVLLPKQAG